MSRPSTSFRQHVRPGVRTSATGEYEQDRVRRIAYMSVGVLASVTQIILVSIDLTRGQLVTGNVVGIFVGLGLTLACYRAWVPIRSINMVVAYGNTVWIGANLVTVLLGRLPFNLSMFIINSIAVFIVLNWLPLRQAVPISLVLTTLLGINVLLFAPQHHTLLAWTVYLNVLFVFMTYFGQRINDARLRQEMLEKLASTDPLTGVLNRRGGWHHLEGLMEQGRGAIILADVDQFKSINDRFGHAVGDDVLRAVAGVMHGPSQARVVARWGGEEFLILLPGMGREEAQQQAQQVLTELRDLPFQHGSRVTMSLGVATVPETVDPDHLIALADARMYAAKQAGGNGWRSG